jgi:AcrR family transcriptional regulator
MKGEHMSGDDFKRDQILDGAGRAFGRYGLRKTTLADVVRESGVARATIYKYFSSKDEIFEAVVQREVEDLQRTVREAVESEGDTYSRLRAAIRTQSAVLREKVNVYRLTVEALSDVIGRTHQDTERLAADIIRLYRWILEEGVKSGEIAVDDLDTTAWSMLLAFKGTFMTAVTGQLQEKLPAAIDRLVEIFWEGLRCREETT